MAVKAAMRVLGFMTGTSLDAVDMAVVETDGEAILALGPAGERKLDPDARGVIEAATRAALAWPREAPRPALFDEAEAVIADQHLIAAREFMAREALSSGDIDLVGVHGQTVLHEPPNALRAAGRTVQLIDAQRLAEGLGLPVAFDFRTADVAAGGQGAPLAPVYHGALVRWSNLPCPVAVLNLGGVGNVTLVRSDGELEAYDTGPANGMIDLFVQARTGARCDVDGAFAAAGRVDGTILATYLAHPYFSVQGPKSLDRYDFSLEPVAALSIEDGAATLTAFAAQAVALGLKGLSQAPRELVVTGGGRLNPVLMRSIGERVSIPVRSAEAVGWRGDSIEAEAFAYLAARTARGLPNSFRGTTGVGAPIVGGRIVGPSARQAPGAWASS
jgi:anhydro-N-acetylmuramic acid kinase